MTGAGRSTAAKELEDLGYYVIDNLPPGLLKDVIRLVDESRGPAQPVAVVIDVRSGAFFDSLAANLAQGRRPAGTRRWSSSRPATRCWSAARRPRAARTRSRATAGCSTGSSASARCWPGCAATPTWSSTPPTLNVHQLTDRIADEFGTPADGAAQGERGQLRLQVRHPGRHRLHGRHAVPAQPALDPRAAAAHRPRPRGGRLRPRPGRAPRSSWSAGSS